MTKNMGVFMKIIKVKLRLDNLMLLIFSAMVTGALAGSIGFYYGMEYERITKAEYYHANFVDKAEEVDLAHQGEIVKTGF